ncbi:MAG: hypothetical protein IIZ40_03515 [Bacilli bacterium]|nr:hypothetical protein [Bacilli bacterium]
MKRVFKIMVLSLLLMVPFTINAEEVSTDTNNKVNVYLFRGEGCPHCKEAESFFDSLAKDEEYSKYYNLVKYEVWYNEDNAKLMGEVAKKLNTEASGVPFIVIGDKYYSGYASSMDTELKETIKSAYENDSYKDIVKSVIEKTDEKKKASTSPLIPIIIVSAIAIITVVVMVFFTKEK